MSEAASHILEKTADEPGEGARAPGFGVYVHWPFCASKCPYCDFNSHVRDMIEHDRWRTALVGELRSLAGRCDRTAVTSVFFGGGTPSLMAPATVAALLDETARLFPLAAGLEVTLEANPTSVEADLLHGMRAAGVNRVSLGVQSLDDEALAFLGRRHSAAEALRAVDQARALFDRVSLDLIYARPGQTSDSWQRELGQVLALEPGHLSLYQLTIEPETVFGRMARAGKLSGLDEGDAADQFGLTRALCRVAGLEPYEISNFAQAGQECRHNLTYWRYGAYLGIGPGAHGRIRSKGRRLATLTECFPERWLERAERQGDAVVEEVAVSAEEQGLEYALMAMRLAEGLDVARFGDLAGRPLDQDAIDRLVAAGLVVSRAGRIAATEAGALVLNSVIAGLV